MIELVHNIYLSMVFIIGILMLVLIGILLAELSIKGRRKKSIFWFLFLCLVVFARNLLEVYSVFGGSKEIIFNKFGLVFNIIPLILIILVFWILWKKLDKKIISFIIACLVGIFSSNFLIMISENLIFKVINLISILLLNLGFYFLIVKYLIDTD